ncbi:hypothetical protein [Pseudomonas tohonis]|uniref:hypothetical protein n=1 Tax=Pseudomonas tohonis TaxID=2725477 RepID=UPI001F2BFB33|nr:hypothetical protein [Pseudomonas tohonis]
MTNVLVVISALLAIVVVIASYVWNFYFTLKYGVSSDPAIWGQLGDYLGGTLNPLLSFISIVLLIRSLRLQNQANAGLIDEIENTRKTEKIRSFEAQLFNMIDSQRQAFDILRIKIKQGKKVSVKASTEAVVAIEDEIHRLRNVGKSDLEIEQFLEATDSFDQLFRLTRIFYIMVKMVSEKLCDTEGFSDKDRHAHYMTLINFTDFALLRLSLIYMQFSDYPPSVYLRSNKEFMAALKEVGLECGLY